MLLELNIKTQKDLNQYLEILNKGEYLGCSITSKKNNYNLPNTLLALIKIRNIKIIPTFSCKANYDQNAANTYNNFLAFASSIKASDINQILLVSGNPKLRLDTVEVLRQYNDPSIKIAVAYNPYSKHMELENKRLFDKLKSPNVNQVWFQLGQDLSKLKTAVELIRRINPQIQIINSILIPTKNLLKSLQFRPWSGVYYTNQFYNNLDFAIQTVEKMKQLSQDLDLEILISGI